MSVSIDLTNQVALVTGASGELGRVIARTLARAGAEVIAHYHHGKERAESLVAELRTIGKKACAVQGDVGDWQSMQALANALPAEFAKPSIVVANAVTQYEWKPLIDQPLEDFDSQYASCTRQLVILAKLFAPAMIAAKQGRFIAINTECILQNQPTMAAYVAGKRGLDGIVRVLSRELAAHNITVNQVAPGWTESDKSRQLLEQNAREYAKTVPMQRRGTDQEVANAVAFLASPLASFTTGAYFPVSGGNVLPAV